MMIDMHAHDTPRMLIERFDAEAYKFCGTEFLVHPVFTRGDPVRRVFRIRADCGHPA